MKDMAAVSYNIADAIDLTSKPAMKKELAKVIVSVIELLKEAKNTQIMGAQTARSHSSGKSRVSTTRTTSNIPDGDRVGFADQLRALIMRSLAEKPYSDIAELSRRTMEIPEGADLKLLNK